MKTRRHKTLIVIILFTTSKLFSITINSDTCSSGGEYFIKGLCGAIHSIAFGPDGMMYVGSLGDSNDEVRKFGPKKIYKISPNAEWEVFTMVECTYITGLKFDRSGNLYILTSSVDTIQKIQTGSIIKVDKNRQHTVIIDDIMPVYHIAFDKENNLYIPQENITYKITSDDHNMIAAIQSSGIISQDFRTIYSKSYGGTSIKKYKLSQAGEVKDSSIVISNLPFSKALIIDEQNSKICLVVWDVVDFLYTINMEGEIINKIRLDISKEFSAVNVGGNNRHVLNATILGNDLFGREYLYGVTWSGDIIKINLEDNN